MNQILVTEKLYVTPELKRKKKIYKFNFILSLIIIAVIISIFFYTDYNRSIRANISKYKWDTRRGRKNKRKSTKWCFNSSIK